MTRRTRWLTAAYAGAVRMYPAAFRDAYGPAMRQTFADLIEAGDPAVAAVVREWVPTLAREHRAAGTGLRLLRPAVAALLVLVLCLVACRWAVSKPDAMPLAICCLAAAYAMARRGGRGLACSRDAVVASAVGAMAGIVIDVANRRLSEPRLGVVVLLVTSFSTAALVLSVVVRLIVEGVRLPGRPAARRLSSTG